VFITELFLMTSESEDFIFFQAAHYFPDNFDLI